MNGKCGANHLGLDHRGKNNFTLEEVIKAQRRS
jgi:hypothetical protein